MILKTDEIEEIQLIEGNNLNGKGAVYRRFHLLAVSIKLKNGRYYHISLEEENSEPYLELSFKRESQGE
jgi:hypothetical protein